MNKKTGKGVSHNPDHFPLPEIHSLLMSDEICGIDLGTCNSTIAVYHHNTILCIQEPAGNTFIPSVVTFQSDDIACGSSALSQSCSARSQVYRDVKCIKGRQLKDITEYSTTNWPFELHGKDGVEPDNDKSYPRLVSFTKDSQNHPVMAGYAFPATIDALLLSYMVTMASREVGHTITKAVITVPALFTEAQIYSTLEAAEMAGLEVLRILPEPCAAAIRYTGNTFHYVLVFDFGGGTLDTTLMEYKNGQFQILCTSGKLELGGRRIDFLLTDKICELAKEQGGHIDETSRTYQRLLREMEDAKIQLSSCEETDIDFGRFFTTEYEKPLEYTYCLTRETMNEWIQDLLEECIETCESCLRKKKVTLGSEDAILLTGGSSHIPAIREMLENRYRTVSIKRDVPPQEVVAQGACMVALDTIGASESIVPDYLAGLSTEYNVLYSFGPQSTVLVEEYTPLTVIHHRTIQVPSNAKFMYLWQLVNEKLVYVGFVDVDKYKGREWRVDVGFTKQLVLELKELEKGEVIPIQYGCALKKKEHRKFEVLNDYLYKVRKAKRNLEEMAEYPNKENVLASLSRLRSIAASYMFTDLNEECYNYINTVMIPYLEKHRTLYE